MVSGIIAARALGPENRGHLALMMLVPMIVTQVGLLGVTNSLTYFIARDLRSVRLIMNKITLLVWIQLVLCTFVNAAVIWVLVRNQGQSVRLAGLITLVVPATIILRSYWMASLQGVKAFRAFNLLRIVQPLLYAIALVIILVFQLKTLTIIASVWTVTNVASTGIAAYAVRKTIPRSDSSPGVSPTSGELIRFGAKGFLGTSSPLETFRLDQMIVAFFLSPVALGIYVASLAFTTLPRLIAQSVGQVAFPYIVSQGDDHSAQRYMWRFFWFSLFASLAIVIPLEFMAPYIVPFAFGESFKDAVTPLQILLLGSVVSGARRVLGEGLRGRGYPSANTVAEIASWVWIVPVLGILVPRLELEGVAIAVVSAALVSLVVLSFFLLASHRRGKEGSITERRTRSSEASPKRAGASVGLGARHIIPGVVVIAALGLGWLAASSPDSVLILIGAVVLLPTAWAVRRWATHRLKRIRAAIPTQWQRPVLSRADGPNLSVARMFYYLAAVFLTLLSFRPLGIFTISDWLFLISLFSAVSVLMMAGRLRFSGVPSGVIIGVVIFAVGGFVSSVTSSDTVASLALLFRLGYLILAWFWLGTIVLTTPRHVTIATLCWLGSAALCGAASIAQLQFGDVIPWTSPVQGRMTGLTQNVNDLGGTMAMAIAPAIMVATIVRTRYGRLTCVAVVLPLTISGLVLSGSVSGMAAASIGLIVWFVLGRVSRNALVAGAIVGLGLFTILTFQQDLGGISPLERFQSSTDSQNQYCSLCSRENNNYAAWRAIQESPIIGEGLTSVTTEGVQVHNMFLGAWFESGILGLTGIIFIVISVTKVGIETIVKSRTIEEWTLALALTASFGSFIVFSMVQPILFQRYGWIGASLLVALAWQQRTATERTVVHSSQPLSRPLRSFGSPALTMKNIHPAHAAEDGRGTV